MPGVEIYFSLLHDENPTKTKLWVPSLWQPISVIRRLIEANVKNILGHQFKSTRLFFNGCEINDAYTLHDYDIGDKHVIQVTLVYEQLNEIFIEPQVVQIENLDKEQNETEINQDEYYTVGDHVDAWDSNSGAWYPGRIDSIRSNPSGSIYAIRFDKPSLGLSVPLELRKIRPPAYRILKVDDLCPGEMVLTEGPEKGLWYSAGIETVRISPRGRSVQVTLTLVPGNAKNSNMAAVQHVTKFRQGHFYRLEANLIREKRDKTLEWVIREGPEKKRFIEPDCAKCADDPVCACDMCGCQKCGMKDEPSRQIVCDECDRPVHLWCLREPLQEVPQDEQWYCDLCRNQTQQELAQIRLQHLESKRRCSILKLRKNLNNKLSKKCVSLNNSFLSLHKDINLKCINSISLNDQSLNSKKLKSNSEKKEVKVKNLNSNLNSINSNWGFGMACASRSSKSSASKTIFGPIAQVPVGTWWRFRVQASEAQVHAPLVSGIHGKEDLGAYSICFSHTNPDDIDLGNELYYSASGGKPPGKRSGQISKDQELTRGNKALAMNCNAPFDGNKGASAGDGWRNGKPVRVLRSGNGRQSTFSSIYLPKIGVRYDGIYKVVRYWPENGHYRRWVFHLRRDDPSPAPWTEAGRNWARRLNLCLTYPSGWCLEIGEKRTRKRDLKQLNRDGPRKNRKQSKTVHENNSIQSSRFEPTEEIRELVKQDELNAKHWNSILETQSQEEFNRQLRETFSCVICLNLVVNPTTTFCGHNFCFKCFNQAIQNQIDRCPSCRTLLNMSQPQPNQTLQQILQVLVEKPPIN